MELILKRTYLPGVTHGNLYLGDQRICQTLEWAWNAFDPYNSCIPEGRYPLILIHHVRLKALVVIRNIPGRQDAMLHPYSQVSRLLRGCISPVLSLADLPAKSYDKAGLKKVRRVLDPAFLSGIPVVLTIKNEDDETDSANLRTHAAFLQEVEEIWPRAGRH